MKRVDLLKGYLESHRAFLILIFLSLLITMTGSQAFAHRVILFAYVEGDTVFTESCFSDGKKCQNSKIEVFDSSGNKLLEGMTDKAGEFSFTAPEKRELRLVLTASMGHRAEYIVSSDDLSSSIEKEVDKTQLQPAQRRMLRAVVTRDAQVTEVDFQQIQSLIEDALDRKLRPMMKLLLKSHEQSISFSEVVGGIGYIFGIMGIVMYFRSKKKK